MDIIIYFKDISVVCRILYYIIYIFDTSSIYFMTSKINLGILLIL